MKLIKKGISFLLVLSLVFGLFSAGLSVSAYNTGDDYPQWLKDKPLDYYVDPWNYYSRECTSFVAHCLNTRNGVAFHNWYGGVNFGNANSWGNAARSIGITVDMNPAVGSIAWWGDGQWGHVAWVEAVSGDTVHIEEYNQNWDGCFHERDINRYSVSGYIHIKDISETTVFANKQFVRIGENITFGFGVSGATNLVLYIYLNGVKQFEGMFSPGDTYTTNFINAGHYNYGIIANYNGRYVESVWNTVVVVNPTVLTNKEAYTVGENATFSFDVAESTNLILYIYLDGIKQYEGMFVPGETYVRPLSAVGQYNFGIVVNYNGKNIESTWHSFIVNPVPPGKPTGLTSPSKTDTTVSLSWNSVTGATGYNVYKGPKKLTSTPITAKTYTATGLTQNTTYSFTVKAVNAGGESVASSALSVTTNTTKPSAPTGLTSPSKTDATVSLSWNSVTGATGYNVYKGSTKLTSTPTTATTYTATDLTQDTAYSFTVKAVNVGGESPASTVMSVTTYVSITITATPTTPTNGNVTVAITYPTNALNKEYKVGNGTWHEYTTFVVVTSNNTLYAKYSDSVGNISATASIIISNICKLIIPEGSSAIINQDNNLLYGLAANLTKADFESNFIVVSGNGRLEYSPANGNLGTGKQVKLIDSGTNNVLGLYTIIIFGDLNGDSNIDSTDAGIITDHENYILNWDSTADASLYKAGDLNGDGNIDSIDAGILVDAENYLLDINQSTGIAD